MGRDRVARPRKPDSGHTGTTSITVRVRQASWNAMKPPLRDRAWLSVAAERGVGACNKALRMFYVG